MSPYSKSFECALDEGEHIFVRNYSTFFDLYGANVDCTTKKNMLSNISYLLHN